MINTLSKILLGVGLLTLLPTDAINAQIQMTHMPKRLEEALLDPNLGAILRANVQVVEHKAVAPTRVAALPLPLPVPAGPTYSNERPRFAAIEPLADDSRSNASKLPTIEQTEMPPGLRQQPDPVSIGDGVPSAPTPAVRADSNTPEAVTSQETVAPQANLKGNTDLQQPLAPAKGQLRFRVTGVSAMVENQPADVTVEVFNPTSHPIGPVEVNVKVPVELTITRFDRDAWLDAERRIIAFQIDRVEPGAIQKIGMKGVSETAGHTVLDVALLSGDTMVAQRSVKTQVFPQQLARKHSFGDESPMHHHPKVIVSTISSTASASHPKSLHLLPEMLSVL